MFPTLSFGDREIAPEQLAMRVARAAGALTRAGIGDGDIFALMLRNGPTALEVMLAGRQIGAYFVPINWHFKSEEVRYILQDCGARVLIIDHDLYAGIRECIPAPLAVFVVQPHGGQDSSPLDGAADWEQQL